MSKIKKYENGLFIFHRDLRIVDNIGIIEACKQCKNIYTCFIFTPEQVGKNNPYKSDNAVQFMIESLEDLSNEISKHGGKLLLLYGNTTKIVNYLVSELDINAIFFNRDYTPYAIKRDNDLQKMQTCVITEDYYLHKPGTIKNGQNGYYHKFTPYYTKALGVPVDLPVNISFSKIFTEPNNKLKLDDIISLEYAMNNFTTKNQNILVSGSRNLGLQRIQSALIHQEKYDNCRDNLVFETTLLSAYIKFGNISIREIYHGIKDTYGINHGIIRELIWRDFFINLLYAYPNTLGHAYNPLFEKILWKTNQEWLELWKHGLTGFPVVDACMRQLNKTGYMHNRGRMIVAHFLIKTLLLDWRDGEKYFAQKLTDYDVANNYGNWLSIVGGGAYSMPYFRVMNPWIQSSKFDKEAIFCKRWIPELSDVSPKDIHKWNTMHKDPKYNNIKYPSPMVDYNEQKEKVLKLYHKYV